MFALNLTPIPKTQTLNRKSKIMFCFGKLGIMSQDIYLTRGKPQAPSSSFLAFLVVSRSSFIIIQSVFPVLVLKFLD